MRESAAEMSRRPASRPPRAGSLTSAPSTGWAGRSRPAASSRPAKLRKQFLIVLTDMSYKGWPFIGHKAHHNIASPDPRGERVEPSARFEVAFIKNDVVCAAIGECQLERAMPVLESISASKGGFGNLERPPGKSRAQVAVPLVT